MCFDVNENMSTPEKVQNGDETPQLKSRDNVGVNCMDIFDIINMVNQNNGTDIENIDSSHSGSIQKNLNDIHDLSKNESEDNVG